MTSGHPVKRWRAVCTGARVDVVLVWDQPKAVGIFQYDRRVLAVR